jgi:tRNA (cmo5U34)-methyltransferase
MTDVNKRHRESPVGDSLEAENARWTFGGGVPEHFDEHVARSVPHYRDSHDLIVSLSDFFLLNGGLVYDLGCSTGSLSRKIALRAAGRGVRLVGIDREPEMVEAARHNCRDLHNVEIQEGSIVEFSFEPADMIVSVYTMQFVPPRHRQQLFDKIYAALNWGGGFFLFEKVRAPDARFQDMMTSQYADYKRSQGFDDVEIANKARSLKGVLEPFSTRGNLDLLARAGFVDVMTVFKYVCFEGFLAIK